MTLSLPLFLFSQQLIGPFLCYGHWEDESSPLQCVKETETYFSFVPITATPSLIVPVNERIVKTFYRRGF